MAIEMGLGTHGPDSRSSRPRALVSRRLNSTVSNDQRRSVYDRKFSELIDGMPISALRLGRAQVAENLRQPPTRDRSVRLEPQLANSLNPRPFRIIGTHFSARAALVFACFADET